MKIVLIVMLIILAVLYLVTILVMTYMLLLLVLLFILLSQTELVVQYNIIDIMRMPINNTPLVIVLSVCTAILVQQYLFSLMNIFNQSRNKELLTELKHELVSLDRTNAELSSKFDVDINEIEESSVLLLPYLYRAWKETEVPEERTALAQTIVKVSKFDPF